MSTAANGIAQPRVSPIEGLTRITRHPLLLVSIGGVAVCLGSFGIWLQWESLPFAVQISNVANLLAPLAFVSAVIERAVEIIVSPWRDAGANKLEAVVSAIKARSPGPDTAVQNAADLKAASDALEEYRGQTQRYAFAASLLLSILAGMVGVRALGPFLDAAKFHSLTYPQRLFFLCFDVALSAAVLSGGADGIHSIVNAVTSFFDATSDKTKR